MRTIVNYEYEDSHDRAAREVVKSWESIPRMTKTTSFASTTCPDSPDNIRTIKWEEDLVFAKGNKPEMFTVD